LAVGVLIAVAVLAIASSPAFVIPSAAQAAGETYTLTGYVTQVLDDDEVMFTDGTHSVKLELKNAKAADLPLHTPVTITVQIVEPDDGGFEVNLVSVDKTGGTGKDAAGPDLPITTAAQIQARPVNDQKVVIQGTITQHLPQLGKDKYLFSDGTGMLVLEIDDIPPSAVLMNQPLFIFGEVEIDDGRIEVEVKGMQPAS
jgi:uncharacterized protein YdeI (BOF family)